MESGVPTSSSYEKPTKKNFYLILSTIIIAILVGIVLVTAIANYTKFGFKELYYDGNNYAVIFLLFCVIIVGFGLFSLFRVVKWVQIIFIIVLFIFNISILVAIILIFVFQSLIFSLVENIYQQSTNTSNDTSIFRIESAFHCCGYNSSDEQRCSNSSYNGLCPDYIKKLLSNYAISIGSVLIVLFVISVIILTFSLIQLFQLYKDRKTIPEYNDKSSNGKGQLEININEAPINDTSS